MYCDITSLCLTPETPVCDAIACIDRNQKGIALVVGPERQLLGTVTDGDIRRAVLARIPLESPVGNLIEKKRSTPYYRPISALKSSSTAKLLELMLEKQINQVPLLDDQEHVVDLITMKDLVPDQPLDIQAVIMAGGFGTRLKPLTNDLPKPMLPVGGRPLMEHIVKQLRVAGIQRVNVTTHYKPEKIKDHFGDGQAFDVTLNYVNEDLPLGTAGALGLLPEPTEPMLVINGDILTDINIRAFVDYHREYHADMTVAVRRYEVEVPYGVVETEDSHVIRIKEKPKQTFFVNAGIYLIEPSVYQHIPAGKSFHMTDLIEWLIQAKRTVVSFPLHEYWLDVGRHDDYARAQEKQAKQPLSNL